jgi:hypothetical protein
MHPEAEPTLGRNYAITIPGSGNAPYKLLCANPTRNQPGTARPQELSPGSAAFRHAYGVLKVTPSQGVTLAVRSTVKSGILILTASALVPRRILS